MDSLDYLEEPEQYLVCWYTDLADHTATTSEEARLWHELNAFQQNMDAWGGLCDENKSWEPPLSDFQKYNIHANWRNVKLHSGGAFITRDHSGNFLHHAREALTFFPNRLTAELRCLEWALKSMKDLAYQEIVIGYDSHDLLDAVMQPSKWPRFRIIIQKINALCASFSSVAFEIESLGSNKTAWNCKKCAPWWQVSILSGIRRTSLAFSSDS